MVKKVCVWRRYKRRATNPPRYDPTRPMPETKGARKMLRFHGTDRHRGGWCSCRTSKYAFELLPLQFFGGMGANDRAEDPQDP